MAASKAKARGAKLRTAKDVAVAVGVQVRTAAGWIECGLPLPVTAADVQRWRRQHRRPGPKSLVLEDDDRGPRTRDYLEEKRKWDAELSRLAVMQRRGELAPVASFQAFFVARVAEARERLLALPPRVAARYPELGRELEEDLRQEVTAILEQLSRYDPLLEGEAVKRGKPRHRRGPHAR